MLRLSAEARVGLFVLAVLLLLGYMTVRVTGLRPWAERGYFLTAAFDTVAGLQMRAKVRMAGVDVGEVEDIRLEDSRPVVVMRIRTGVRVPVEAVASIRTVGLLGEKYVELLPPAAGRLPAPARGAPEGPLPQRYLKPGERVRRSETAADLDRLIERFTAVGEDLQAVSSSFRAVFGGPEGQEGLQRLFDNLGQAAGGLQKTFAENQERINRIVANVEELSGAAREIVVANRETVDRTLRNFEGISAALRKDLPALVTNLNRMSENLGAVVSENREDIRKSIVNIREAFAKLDKTLNAIKDVTQQIREGKGTVGKLVKEDTAYERFTRAATSFGNIAKKIERGEGTLGKLVTEESAFERLNEALAGINRFVTQADRFKTFVGFRGEYQTDEGAAKGYFTLRIQPREDKFYLFEVVDAPRGHLEIRRREVITTDEAGNVSRVRTRTLKRDDKLTFTAMFGKRFGDTTLRVGLEESTFGLGLDQSFFDDRLVLSFDLYDFEDPKEEDDPTHLKIAARYHFLNRFFVQAGVDDLLSDDFRTLFLGAGLTFRDDDLRFLLQRLPLPST
ncbi:MAG: MlaD family protein [Nitrospinota bacterium]